MADLVRHLLADLTCLRQLLIKRIELLQIVLVARLLRLHGLELVLRETLTVSQLHSGLLPALEQLTEALLVATLAQTRELLGEAAEANLELRQVRAELVEIALHVLRQQRLQGSLALLEADLEHGDYLCLVLHVKDRIVHNILELLACHRADALLDVSHALLVATSRGLGTGEWTRVVALLADARRVVVVEEGHVLLQANLVDVALVEVGRVWPLVWLHGALLAHLKDAAVVEYLLDESALVLEIVNMVVLELVEERQLLLDPAIELGTVQGILATGKARVMWHGVLSCGRDL